MRFPSCKVWWRDSGSRIEWVSRHS
jgi:hypothetical protein